MVDANGKQSFTVMATIRLSSAKHAPTMIMPGKARGTLRPEGEVMGRARELSRGGWERLEAFVRYVKGLQKCPRHQHGRMLDLVQGCFSVARCTAAGAVAEAAGV